MPRRQDDYDRPARAIYEAYIASPEWTRRRHRALARAGYRCQYESEHPIGKPTRCVSTRHLEVHHLTYQRLGHELDADLEVLCWAHHMSEHLSWRRCPKCCRPLLGSYEEAYAWLKDYLVGERIPGNLDWVPWKRLPRKFALEAALPEFCVECAPFLEV